MKVLLAEDDASLRETLAEGLRADGYDVTTAANGQLAVQAVDEGGPFKVAILDALLPKMTGFDCARVIRERSPSTEIVLMSGVFKSPQQQQDNIAKTGARAYLVKPFDLKRLVDTLRPFAPPPTPQAAAAGAGGASGVSTSQERGSVQQQPLPAEGSLLETSALALAWRIHREQHTGILELTGPHARARMFCFRGRAVFAQHSDPVLNVGVEMIKAGTLTAEQYQQACDLAVKRSVGLYEMLRGEEMATEADIKASYRTLVPLVLERLATMQGRFRWHATDAFQAIVPAAATSILENLFAGLRKAPLAELEPHLVARRPLRVAPGETWAEIVPILTQTCGSDSLTRAINGRATVAQLIEAAPTEAEKTLRARQAFLLVSTSAVRTGTEAMSMAAQGGASSPGAPTAATSPPPAASVFVEPPPVATRPSHAPASVPVDTRADDGVTFSTDEQSARARVVAKAKELEGKDFWGVLNVKRGADAATIKKAYFALSRDFHPDSFAGLRLGSVQRRLDDVFSLIQEAYATLSDDHKRGEYEAKQSFEAGGGSSDIGAIFAAEADFGKCKLLVERGEYVAALKLVDKVANVLASNEEVRGFKLYLTWWQTKNAATAEQTIRELAALYKASPASHALGEFQGAVYSEIGNLKHARAAYKRVLDADPNHSGAIRGMRAVNKKIEDAEKGSGGFFRR